jgi:hypothetical protein
MIRLSTCVSVLLACGSGLYLYQTKHQAQVLDKQIDHTVKAISATRTQTRELAAAWTLLGNPERLQQLSDQFLDIKSVLPSQFVAMADLNNRLPAPRALAPPASDAPGDTRSEITPIATLEPTGAPDTPITPAPAPPVPIPSATTKPAAAMPPGTTSPGITLVATTSAAIGRGASITASPLPAPSASPGTAGNTDRTPAVAGAASGPPAASDAAKPQTAATVRPADRKPSDTTPRPVREVPQAHPVAPRQPGPPPVVAQLEHPAQPPAQYLASTPAPLTGSVLGMARIAVRPPVPLPVGAGSSSVNGN